MKRARLQTVVRVRALQEQLARGAVTTARRTVDDRSEARRRASNVLDELAAERPRTPSALRAHRRLLDGRVDEVAGAERAVAAACADVATALDGWHGAARRLEGVERLDERLAVADEDEATRQEALALDDVTVMRWHRRDQPGDES